MRRNWLLGAALLLAVVALIYGATVGALWDPHEISVAELSRRIGLNVLGDPRLRALGADNSVPIRADLGRGELPFTSAAVGFRLLGLSAWAGRLPLVLWALLGLASLFAATARLWDRRTALYAALILSTTPLYFLQARALLGDAVTLATFTMAWSGLAAACFAPLSASGRWGFALLGAVGLYAGFWCRGPLFNVAAPALAVGVAAILEPQREPVARWIALGAAVVGLLALALGISGLSLASATKEYSVFVGSALLVPVELPTFDVALGNLAHAGYPWSALAPLALALIAAGSERPAERGSIRAAALGLAFGLAACAWLAPLVGMLVVPSVACFASLCAGALRQLETGRMGSRLLALLVAAFAAVIGWDLRENPDKVLVGFGLAGAKLPEALAESSSRLWLGGAALLALVTLMCLAEQERAPADTPAIFERAEYGRVLSAFQTIWNGNLVFALLLLEAALIGFLLLSAISERWLSLPQLDGFGSFARKVAALAAIAVPLLPLAALATLGLRDLARVVFSGRPSAATRAQGVLLAFAAVGGVMSLGFFPALARQLSPTQAFERYRVLARPGEPLAVLGQQGGAARYQGAPAAESFEEADLAFEWLTAPDAKRRWLVLRQAELPELNARFRALHGKNLPILDARSSELLLGSNLLGSRERNQSPLAPLLPERPPQAQHPLHAVLGEQLEVLGWSLRGPDGRLAGELATSAPSRLTLYFRVLGPLRGAWQVFVHIDGLQRRFNADHEPLDGRYPMRLWRKDDYLADSTEVRLEPNFAPGLYRLRFGLFSGDRRLPVLEGPADDDRVVAGTLQVR